MNTAFEPPANAFTQHFVVPNEDIDDLGHVGNVAWVRWLQEAATAHSTSIGLGLEEYRARGVLFVVRKHEIEYLVPAFRGETIEAVTWIASVKGATSVRRTLFRRPSDEALLVRAATTWVLITIPSGRPTRIPAELGVRYGFSG